MKTKKITKIKAKLFRIFITGFIVSLSIILFSCDEEEFLMETPLDFYAPENSFVTFENFESTVANLYSVVRSEFYTSASARSFPPLAWNCTDLIYTHKDLGINPNWGSILLPTNTSVVYDALWGPAFRIIYDANVIIGRADADASQLTDQQKIKIKAEASFFRAYAYKILANLYGGVPIVLEEVTTPKRDFVRASREEVYEQCVSDLIFAAENLADIGETDDSRINKLAAYHMLSEVYISLEKWQDAIDAATIVIDHPNTALMTQRFGTRKDDPDFGGDVYWDLFRQGNQNYSTGNTEAIWVMQYEFLIPGGAEGFLLERAIVPRLWQAKIANDDGSSVPLIPYPNTYYYGRGSGFMRPSDYFFGTVWQKSGYSQDIRNSEYNIVRDFIVNNPASDHNGKWVFKDSVPIALKSVNDTTRNFFPVIAKASTPGKHPVELYHSNQTVPGSLTNDARNTYRDRYIIRLAETYLLRAEAYLGNNNTIKAAEDINVVRSRANASDINSADVDLDYILDERLRELYFEELRLLTLTRLGKLVERTLKYNPSVGNTFFEHNDLWPIPYDDIEKNIEAVLEQNPGY